MDIVKNLHKWLYQNKIFAEEVYNLPGDEVVVTLQGDWKHDHLRCDILVKEFCTKNGFVLKDKSMDVLEEDGSDFYVADHYYKILVDNN